MSVNDLHRGLSSSVFRVEQITQNPLVATPYGFDPHHRHQSYLSGFYRLGTFYFVPPGRHKPEMSADIFCIGLSFYGILCPARTPDSAGKPRQISVWRCTAQEQRQAGRQPDRRRPLHGRRCFHHRQLQGYRKREPLSKSFVRAACDSLDFRKSPVPRGTGNFFAVCFFKSSDFIISDCLSVSVPLETKADALHHTIHPNRHFIDSVLRCF